MSSAAVSEATTQPRSSRPRTSGRTPWGSRAAYRVCSSMNTKQKAPRRRGSTSRAAASRERSGSSDSSAVTRAVSVVLPRRSSPPSAPKPSRRRTSTRSRSSVELMRLPLWASATVLCSWPPRVGWAFSQVEPPVVEYRQWPTARWPLQRAERALVEDLRDQAHVLVDQDAAAVGGGDARRLLPSVLQGVQAEVGELGDVLAGSPDAEDATGVLRPLLAGEQVVGEPSVSACHAVSLPQGRTRQRRRSSSTARTAASIAPMAAPKMPR